MNLSSATPCTSPSLVASSSLLPSTFSDDLSPAQGNLYILDFIRVPPVIFSYFQALWIFYFTSWIFLEIQLNFLQFWIFQRDYAVSAFCRFYQALELFFSGSCLDVWVRAFQSFYFCSFTLPEVFSFHTFVFRTRERETLRFHFSFFFAFTFRLLLQSKLCG